MSYRVDFLRRGLDDHILFETLADAEAFVAWGQHNGSAFVRATITAAPREYMEPRKIGERAPWWPGDE